ncbi:MAG: DMT family transporter, partial [Myxococcota bacterium]|nr:DMT family transporter [Myxococcota bacterium]
VVADGVMTPPPSKWAGHAALASAQVAFGLFPIFGTLAFGPGGVTPLGLGVWRIAAGGLVLALLVAWQRGPSALLPARADVPRILACAWLGVALNQGLFLSGLARSTPMSAGIVMCLIPVFTYAAALLAGQERLRLDRLAGLAIALCGVGPLVFPEGIGVIAGYGLGNALLVCNAAAYSAYVVLGKPLVARYPPLVVTAWAYLGSFVAIPAFARDADLLPAPDATMAWAGLVYVVVFPTILGYLANLFALARVPATTTAVYVYVQPIVAGIGAWWMFAERPGTNMAVAALALLTGVGLVVRR